MKSHTDLLTLFRSPRSAIRGPESPVRGRAGRRLLGLAIAALSVVAVAGCRCTLATATFRNDTLRSTVVATDAAFFSKDPYSINFGRGSAELSYRPVAFDGEITATELALGLNFGEPGFAAEPKPIDPLDVIPEACDPDEEACQANFDGLPEVELFDVEAGIWRRLPHLDSGSRFAVSGPARFVDPATGTVLIRFVNDRSDGVGFSLDLSITGDVR